MVLVNYATKEIIAKIVYYGPGLCGKTTNLHHIYTKVNPKKRGKMISLATEADRTLFFDFLPVELGVVQGFNVRFQVYTVPGQVFYSATRKLVLKGADAVVFVADSQDDVVSKNVESVDDMKHNLLENGLDPMTIPVVFQYNKRDLPNVIDVTLLDKKINYRDAPRYDAAAINGTGVIETFRGIITLLIEDLKRKHSMMEDGIKELPPDLFETKEDALPGSGAAFELELGSSIKEDGLEAGGDAAPQSILDLVESITLADSLQAEVFFDSVREGREAEEAKRKAKTAGAARGIELSDVSGDFNIEREGDEAYIPLERELTAEEILDAEEAADADEGFLAEPPVDKPEPVRDTEHPQATNKPEFDIIPLIERLEKLFSAKFDGLEQRVKEALEGQDQLMLAVLEAVRDMKKNFSDANEKIEDTLKRLAIKPDEKAQKKKWF